MKNSPAILSLLAFVHVGCSEQGADFPRGNTTHAGLIAAYERPPASFSLVQVSCSIAAGEKSASLETLTLRRGRSSKTSKRSELIYPTEFNFPELPPTLDNLYSGANSFPITPANPTAFDVTEVGWTLELTARPRDGFVMLEGLLTQKAAGDPVSAAGIPFQPIVTEATDALGRKVPVILTANRAERPTIVTKEFPIYIAATPGGKYSIPLEPGVVATIGVDIQR